MTGRSLLAAILLTLGLAASAGADAVRLSGFWINGVTIRSMNDGLIVYTSAAGNQVVRRLDEVEGIQLRLYPQIERAREALEDGDHAQAVNLLREVQRRSRQDWVHLYVTGHLVEVHVAAGQPLEAAAAYIDLMRAGAHRFFVRQAPLEVVAWAPDEVKREIAQQVVQAMDQATGDSRAALERLLEAAGGPPGSETMPPEAGAATAVETTQAASAVTLPAALTPSPTASLLRQGQFPQALEAAESAMQTVGQTAEKLYLLGMAQLAQARTLEAPDLYKDAGLNFMRVVVHFPRSAVAGPAMLEAGVVHAAIGREDQARKLYDRARLLIDPRDESAYHQRLLRLAGHASD